MDARPGIENLCCLNSECKFYGQTGRSHLRLRKVYGADRIRYLRCSACGMEFSERKGTALFNCKISEAQAVSVIDHLDRSCGVVATAELVGVCKDTVSRLLFVSGRSSRQVHDRTVRGLSPDALQFDEKWGFVAKKRRQVTEADTPGEVGDQWDTVGLDPQSKLVVSLVPGPRTGAVIHQVVAMRPVEWPQKRPCRRCLPIGKRAMKRRSARSLAGAIACRARVSGAGPPSPCCASLRRWSMPKWSNTDKAVASKPSRSGPFSAKASCPKCWTRWGGTRPTLARLSALI